MDKYYTVDGGEDIRRDMNVAGEPYIPHVQALVNRGKPISVFEYWQINKRRNEAHKRYLDKWNNTISTGPGGKKVDVDVLLAPALPHTSVPHRSFRWVGYTKIWNFLDYPALTMPFGNVEKDVDNAEYQRAGVEGEGYVPRNELDEWNWKLWDAEMMDGFPVNLQIVGRKLDEERVLGAARVIEEVWKSRGTA